MTKTSIKKKLINAAGGRELITKKQIMESMRIGKATIGKMLDGLPVLVHTEGKTAPRYYDVDDVAERLAEYIRY